MRLSSGRTEALGRLLTSCSISGLKHLVLRTPCSEQISMQIFSCTGWRERLGETKRIEKISRLNGAKRLSPKCLSGALRTFSKQSDLNKVVALKFLPKTLESTDERHFEFDMSLKPEPLPVVRPSAGLGAPVRELRQACSSFELSGVRKIFGSLSKHL